MPRAHISKVLQNPDGSVMTGASVRVLADGATTNIADALYTTDAGSSTLTNPFTSTDGRIEFYLDNPQRIQIGITPPGGTESFITADAAPDALNTVVADVHLNLGTPVPGSYLHVNSSGQFEYVGIASGLSRVSATPQLFLVDSSGAVWAVSVDATGHLVTSGEGGSASGATTGLYFSDGTGGVWELTISTDGHLVTGSA